MFEIPLRAVIYSTPTAKLVYWILFSKISDNLHIKKN